MTKPKSFYLELWALVVLSVLAFFLFRNSDLDLWAARLFYHPEKLTDPWFEQDHPLWIFFYFSAPWLTGILLFGSLAVLAIAQYKDHLKGLQIYAVYAFLVIALGSGLFVNGVFKPYWGRPRPREVIELGGKHEYRPFYSPQVGSPGKSFPCGHCSVGFSYGLLWWILRRKKPVLAAVALGSSLGLGTLMGIGRIAAGGHFFSDVVWAGLIVYWVCFWVYHVVLKIPLREQGQLRGDRFSRFGSYFERHKSANTALYSGLAFFTVLILLVASPFHREFSLEAPSFDASKTIALQLRVDHARVDLELDEKLASAFVISGFAKGFGFPGNKVISTCDSGSASTSDLQPVACRIHRKGFFSDYESIVQLKINPRLVRQFRLQLIKGEVFRNEGVALPPEYLMDLKN